MSPLISGCVTWNQEVAQGVRELRGTAFQDGIPLKPGMPLIPGKTLTTGAGTWMTVVVGGDALLIHDNTELLLSSRPLAQSHADPATAVDAAPQVTPTATAAGSILGYTLKRGRVLSVFSPGLRSLQTPNATIGIRGTGIYMEYEPGRTYFCTCYGASTLQARNDPSVRESIQALHHDARFIRDATTGPSILEKGPMHNHTDDELILLERLVGRIPPFVQGSSQDEGYGK
ncbi:MAG: hypothetical protein HQL76_08480 [Magnetococcales bacterium]|nr:hypothetical protein [Magnetococcales bacterium]